MNFNKHFIRIFFLGLLFHTSATFSADLSLSPETLSKLSDEAQSSYVEGAVVLHKNMVTTFDENGLEQYRYYIAIKILDNEAAKDYSQLSSTFNSHYFEKEIEFARVINKAGEVTPLKKDAISYEHEGMNNKSLDDIQNIKFALPNINPGNIIELQITGRQIKPIIDGHWNSQFRFNYVQFVPSRNWIRVDPVMYSRLELKVPAEKKLNWKLRNLNSAPIIKQQKNTVNYVFEVEKLPSIEMERNMSSLADQLPLVQFSTMENWKVIDKWAIELFANKLETTPEIKKVASMLSQNHHTVSDKVEAVYRFIQDNIRYVGAHVNRGGYEPHTASEVLNQGYGDCKDQSVLIIALLKAMNIQAFPALINPVMNGDIDKSFPYLNFSHMITYIPDLNLWLDTSDQTGNFPGIFSTLELQHSLIITGKGGLIKQLPQKKPEENVVDLKIAYEPTMGVIHLNLDYQFAGHMDTLVRNIISALPDKSTFIKQLVAPINTSEVSKYDILNLEDWSKPLKIIVRMENVGSFSEELTQFSYADTLASVINSFTEFNLLEKPEERTQDFYLPFAFQMTIHRDYPNVLDNASLAFKQPATELDSDFFRLTHRGEMDDHAVKTQTTLQLKSKEIELSSYKAFYEQVKQIYQHGTSTFVFAKNFKKVSEEVPQSESAAKHINYIESLLDAGLFEKALKHSTKTIKTFPEHGRIHHLHAIALGFNDRFEESENMFKKAEEMGH